MEELEKQEGQEFDLEDILREFADEPAEEAPTQSGVEAILKEFADDPDAVVHIDDAPLVIEPEEESPAVTTDTVRMEPVKIYEPAQTVGDETIRMDPITDETIRMAAVSDETIRMDPITDETIAMAPVASDTIRMEPITDETIRKSQVSSDTIRMEPIGDDTIRVALPKGQVRIAKPVDGDAREKEAFSESWEPEYEQPMGSYNPGPQIIVHPRSRLRELKRKLVAGPEKRYYELSALGLGRIQAAIFFSFLVLVATAGATVLYAMGKVPENRMRLMVFSQFFFLLVSALLGSGQLVEGVADLFKGRFSLNTLLVFTFGACCVDGVLGLRELRVPCCAAFSLQVTMSLWGAYHKRYTEMGQMDTLRKATHLDGVGAVKDYHEGRKGLLRFEGQVEHFMDNYNKRFGTEKVLGWYGLAVLLISAGVGYYAATLYGRSVGIQVGAMTAMAGAPAIAFISQTRPMAILERRLHKLGTVLCGPQGMKGLCGKAVLPIEYGDLFPAGTVRMNGVKFFGSRRPDDIVAYCTAMIAADGSGLTSLFQQVADSRNAPHYDAKNLVAYENGGIGGTIHGEEVLVGSIAFLEEMGVEIPEGIRVSQAVCVAIQGQLCGLFALNYEKSRAAAAGLNTVCSWRKLRPVVAVSDFAMTDALLRSRFGSHVRKVKYPEQEIRAQLRQKQLPEDAQALLMTTREGFSAVAYGVTGARALRAANIAGLVIGMVGGLAGLAMMALLVHFDGLQMLTPTNLLAYQLVWVLPGLLVSGWTRLL